MLSRFEEILEELSVELGVKLEKDPLNACKLRIDDKISIQLEPSPAKESLLVATFISDIPPGKFREYTLRDALIANGEFPRIGTLGYSEKNNKLALFEYLPMVDITGEKLVTFLELFAEKAIEWMDSIEGGAPSPLTEEKKKGNGGMYGLKS